MKMFAVLALAAVAFAEPEPQVVYSGTPLSNVYTSAYGYSSPLLRAFTPYTTYNGVYGSPVVHTIGKRDADAEPATVYTTGVPVTAYGAVSHVASPLATVNSVVAPVSSVSPVATYSAVNSAFAPVSTYSAVNGVVAPVATHSAVSGVVAPVSTYSAVNGVVAPVAYNTVKAVAAPVSTYVAAPVTHSLTSYNNPSHYTAVSNGAFGPKYIAKNHGVEHVVKRDAEPQVSVYSGLPSVVPATYSAVPATYSAVPATYSAVPATTYSAVPVTYAAGHVVKGAYAPHAVAATPFGLTHSSNVGVCTNNMGVQVPC